MATSKERPCNEFIPCDIEPDLCLNCYRKHFEREYGKEE